MTRLVLALCVMMATGCAAPRLVIRHTDLRTGTVDIDVDGVPRGSLPPGASLGLDVTPGVCRVVVRRAGAPTRHIALWIEGPAELDIITMDGATPTTEAP